MSLRVSSLDIGSGALQVQSVGEDRLGETEEAHFSHILVHFVDNVGVVDMRHIAVLDGSDEVLDLDLAIVVGKFVVSEVIVDLGRGQKLEWAEEGGLSIIESLGEDDSCNVDFFFLGRRKMSGLGSGDGEGAIDFGWR